MCSALSLSAETAFVSQSLFQSSIIRGEFQKNYGTGVVTQEVVDRVNQKSTPLPGGGGGPPPPPPPKPPTTEVINAVSAAGPTLPKTGAVTLYNAQRDGLRILQNLTKNGETDHIAITNCANATSRSGGGQEGSLLATTNLTQGYRSTTDHLINTAGRTMSVTPDKAALKILRTKNVRWTCEPDTVTTTTGFLSGHVTKGAPNTNRIDFDIFSVAAVSRNDVVKNSNPVNYNHLKGYMEKLFSMMLSHAASVGVDQLVFVPSGTSIFAQDGGTDANGNPTHDNQWLKTVAEAVAATVNTYHDSFKEIHIPNAGGTFMGYLTTALNTQGCAFTNK